MTFSADVSLGSIIAVGGIMVSTVGLVWRLATYNTQSNNRFRENKISIEGEKAERAKLAAIVTRMDSEGGMATRNRFRELEKDHGELLVRVVSLEAKVGTITEMAADMRQVRKDVDEILKLFPRQPPPHAS